MNFPEEEGELSCFSSCQTHSANPGSSAQTPGWGLTQLAGLQSQPLLNLTGPANLPAKAVAACLGLWQARRLVAHSAPAGPAGLHDHCVDGELEAQMERIPSRPAKWAFPSRGLPQQRWATERHTKLRKKV